MKKEIKTATILFDGYCKLCHQSVRFIIKNDQQKQFNFVSLQSDAASKLLLQFPDKKINLDSLILIKQDQLHIKSEAILLILKMLDKHPLLYFIGKLLPKKMGDSLYDFVAKRRYFWFGRTDTCEIDFKA